MTAKPASMPNVQVGQIRTFGSEGPKYEVTGSGRWSDKLEGEWVVPIRVVASGEELEYRYSRFSQDSEAK